MALTATSLRKTAGEISHSESRERGPIGSVRRPHGHITRWAGEGQIGLDWIPRERGAFHKLVMCPARVFLLRLSADALKTKMDFQAEPTRNSRDRRRKRHGHRSAPEIPGRGDT